MRSILVGLRLEWRFFVLMVSLNKIEVSVSISGFAVNIGRIQVRGALFRFGWSDSIKLRLV